MTLPSRAPLANEMLATKLGIALGLPMPRVEVIEVSDWLIERTKDLLIDLGGVKIPCRSGKQLGSLYEGCDSPGMTFDYLPGELLQRAIKRDPRTGLQSAQNNWGFWILLPEALNHQTDIAGDDVGSVRF